MVIASIGPNHSRDHAFPLLHFVIKAPCSYPIHSCSTYVVWDFAHPHVAMPTLTTFHCYVSAYILSHVCMMVRMRAAWQYLVCLVPPSSPSTPRLRVYRASPHRRPREGESSSSVAVATVDSDDPTPGTRVVRLSGSRLTTTSLPPKGWRRRFGQFVGGTASSRSAFGAASPVPAVPPTNDSI